MSRERDVLARLVAPLATREVFLDCTNWRGQRRVRRVEPSDIVYAATEWHPAPQWLLCALDLEKRQMRSFALAGIHGFSTELPPAPPAPEAAPDEATLALWERITSDATPGPWWPGPGDELGLEVMAGEPARPQATREERKGQTSVACTHGSEANQVFIALARSAMPKLIAALRQARAAEQTWRVSTEGALAMLKTAQRERDEALSGDAYDGMARKLADRTEDVLRAEEALRQARAERVAMGERAVDEGRLLQARLAYAQTDRDEARAEATAAEGVIEAAQDAARALREHDHACADQDEPTRRRTCAACVGERLSRALTAHGGRRG